MGGQCLVARCLIGAVDLTLEWPPFNGSLSAQLRELNYVEGLFSVGGGLRIQRVRRSYQVSG